MEEILSRARRTSKLGRLGEILAAESLAECGFQEIIDLNTKRHNHPFADLLAHKDGHTYFIGVKSRNENRDVGGLNASYNCILVPDLINRRLKASGMTTDQITQRAIDQIGALASEFSAIPAWIALPIRATEGTYAAYFGLLSDLGLKRSIPMTDAARNNYKCLANWRHDPRISGNLTNAISVHI